MCNVLQACSAVFLLYLCKDKTRNLDSFQLTKLSGIPTVLVQRGNKKY